MINDLRKTVKTVRKVPRKDERLRGRRKRRLLLLSCSQSKVSTPGKLAALQRYDGPAFQVVRRYLRETADEQLIIRILSAEFGLITSAEPIKKYNRKMNSQRVAELQGSCLESLRMLDRKHRFGAVFVCMSKLYLGALDGIERVCYNVSYATPGQGKKLASLYRWLRGEGHD